MTTRIPPTTPRILECRGLHVDYSTGPVIVGIVNVTPDSFYDGGRHDTTELAVQQAERLIAEGAGMLDIGGQSTRPGHQEISDDEEIARVVPVIAALAGRTSVPLSIDTYKPAVACAALEAGAHVVNDIHGLQRAPELARLAQQSGAAVIAMHYDETFAVAPGDVVAMQLAFFRRTLAIAVETVDAKLLSLQARQENSQTKDEIAVLLQSLGRAIHDFNDRYEKARFQSSQTKCLMFDELNSEFVSLGMREIQENCIKAIIESRTDQLVNIFDFSSETEKTLNDLSVRLGKALEPAA